MSLKVVVIGASPDPSRYSHFATLQLQNTGYEVLPIGIRPGLIGGIPIEILQPDMSEVHTVTVYLRPSRHHEVIDYVRLLNPLRIIANPGAESRFLRELADAIGCVYLEDCTLVLLSTGAFETAGFEGEVA